MTHNFKPGDIVSVRYPNSRQKHIVKRYATTMSGEKILITINTNDKNIAQIQRLVSSIILSNTQREYQWFYPNDSNSSIWNTTDKLSLMCWEHDEDVEEEDGYFYDETYKDTISDGEDEHYDNKYDEQDW